MNVEVEVRSFISKENFNQLLKFFHKHANYLGHKTSEINYFNTSQDLRIEKSNSHAKLILKSGKIHDDAREEIEIKFNPNDFKQMERLFNNLGTNVEIKWFRERDTFEWDGITVTLDDTKGYGYKIELEIISPKNKQESALAALKEKLEKLNIPLTPREEFEQAFVRYKANWRELTK